MAMIDDSVQRQLRQAVTLPGAAVAGWATLWVDGLLIWQRLCQAQLEMLGHHASAMRSGNWIARGADWMDHYGKRARDVNVERV